MICILIDFEIFRTNCSLFDLYAEYFVLSCNITLIKLKVLYKERLLLSVFEITNQSTICFCYVCVCRMRMTALSNRPIHISSMVMSTWATQAA